MDHNQNFCSTAATLFSHSIFVDSLFKEVLFARTFYLIKGGLIIPNIVCLFASGMEYTHRPICDEKPVTVIEDYVNGDQICTDRCFIKQIDLRDAHVDDDSFRVRFQLMGTKTCRLGGMVLHMDVGFTRPDGRVKPLFSTSPKMPRTYLRQTILFVDDVVEVDRGEVFSGTIGMYANEWEAREVEYSLAFENFDAETSSESEVDSMESDTESSDSNMQIEDQSPDVSQDESEEDSGGETDGETEEDSGNGTENASEMGSEHEPDNEPENVADMAPENEDGDADGSGNRPEIESENMIQDMEESNSETELTPVDNPDPEPMPLDDFMALFKAPGFYVERDPSEFF